MNYHEVAVLENDDVQMLERRQENIRNNIRNLQEELAATQKRIHELKFGHPVGTVIRVEGTRGYGTRKRNVTQRYQVTRFTPYGVVVRCLRADGKPGAEDILSTYGKKVTVEPQ